MLHYFIANSTLKIKCGKSGMQENVFIMGVWCGSVTRDHCSASRGLPRDAEQ